MLWEKLADPNHPIWKLAMIIIVVASALVSFQVWYQSKIALADLQTILTMVSAMIGLYVGKAKVIDMITKYKE